MKTFNANPAAHMTWPWHCRLGAALLSLGFLLSCGDGDGGPGPELVVPPSPTVLQGAYQASHLGNDFVSFVTPDNKLYALYFLATRLNVVTLPEIFSGPITPGQDGAAEIPPPFLKVFANKAPYLQSGSGTFSSASSLSYQLQLIGLSTADGQTPTFGASALATSADLSGTWTGTWADSKTNSTLTQSAITFGTAVQPTAWDFFSYCQTGSTLALMPATYTQLGGAGSVQTFFQARLTIPQITLCVRTEKASVELSGVAFVHAPVAGKRRLYLVLVDGSGSGISFRGDQQ